MESKFESICKELITLQKAKNADYGNSFSKSVQKFGLTAALIPITNKVNRLNQLVKSDSAKVKDESVDDTLRDLACYAIMTLVERKQPTLNDIWASLIKNITSLEESFDKKTKDSLHKTLGDCISKYNVGYDTPIIAREGFSGIPELIFIINPNC